MPFRPGTGTAYGKPALTFSISAGERARTLFVDSSSLAEDDGSAAADGVAAVAGVGREADRRVAFGVLAG